MAYQPKPVKPKRLCSVPGCDLPHAAKGLCGTHYHRKRRTGTTDPRRYLSEGNCKVSYCNGSAQNRGYCDKHYGALRDFGDPYVIKYVNKRKDYPCCIIDCEKPQHARGLCYNHYALATHHKRKGNINDLSDYLPKENQKRYAEQKTARRQHAASHTSTTNGAKTRQSTNS